ncbi:MAG: hypothetical protein ABEI57_05210 [Halapricum sp.]
MEGTRTVEATLGVPTARFEVLQQTTDRFGQCVISKRNAEDISSGQLPHEIDRRSKHRSLHRDSTATIESNAAREATDSPTTEVVGN